MGIFDKNKNLSYRFPSFYNSTWHKYSIPSTSWLVTQPVFSIGNIDTSNMVANAQNGVNWNPFGWTAMSMTGYNPNTGLYRDPSIVTSPREILPTNLSYLAPPAPYRPFYSSSYDYDDIYSDEDPNKKPVSKQTIENVKMGLNGATLAIDALGQGRTTGAGEKDANYYINAASKLGSNLPGEAGLFFSGINAASSLLNALAGSQLDEKNIKAFESAIQNRARWQMGDNSTTSALVGSSANNVDLRVPGVKYFGKNPLLSDILGYGVGKASAKAWSMKQPTAQANAQAHNTEALGYKDYQNKYIRNGLLAGSYALGGAINRFDNGGGINTPRTHGSLFNTGLTEINAGGRHSENLFGGVLFGVDQYGIPNLVEEGETVFNAQSYGGPLDYAFSDEIEFPIKEYGHLFSLGGITKRKKGKYKKYTFADVSKYLAEDVKQNPNSDIVKRTFAENAGKLANIQEEVKAKDMINLMNPMDIMVALQQSPMGEQMVSDTLGSMDLQAMMGQEPMIAACGGKLHSFGGNIFRYGGRSRRRRNTRRSRPRVNVKVENGIVQSIPIYEGNFSSAFNAARSNGNATFEWNGRAYNTRLRGESLDDYNNYLNNFAKPAPAPAPSQDAALIDYSTSPVMLRAFGGNLFANGGHIFAKGGDTYNNTLTGEGDEAYNPPESLAIHSDLFHKAIQEYISDYKLKYDAAIKNKDYLGAVSIASDLMGNLNIAQYLYVNAATNPSKANVIAMLSYFDELGLNKYVSRFLNDKTRGENGDAYPVYQKGKAYTKDNSIDGKWGVISLNRFISYDNIAADMLKSMGINSSNFYDSKFIKDLSDKLSSDKAYNIGSYDSAQEYIRNLQAFDLAEADYYKKVRNPKYTEGGTEPEYIYFADAVAPEGTENTYEWWEGLDEKEKESYRSKYRLTGDPIRTGPYEWSYIYEPIDGASNLSSTQKGKVTLEGVNASETANNKKTNEYYVPKPRNDWESSAALAIAAADYINAMFGEGRTFKSPGIDTAYNYLSKVGNIPMVRNIPTGTKMAYRPTDLNFGLNNDRSDMFGLIRTAGNINKGNAVANDITIMNAGRELMAKTRLQAIEDDLKKLQFVLSNNNLVDLFNAQNSLTAQTTNALNLARAREAQASIASQLSGTLGQNYKNWLDYRNAQSSGLAQMLHDQGYNKQVLNLRDAAFLLNNLLKDALKTAGIPYEVVQDVLNTYRG